MRISDYFAFCFFLILLPPSLFPSPIFPAGEARGDEFKLIPSFVLKEEYNDNLFFTDQQIAKDFIATAAPALQLIERTEKFDAELLARVGVLKYVNNQELDNVDQNYSGKARYSLTPNWKIWGDASYVIDSRPDRDLAVTGLVNNPVVRHLQNYLAGIEHVFSEKAKATLFYNEYYVDYSKSPQISNLKAHDANLGFIHDLGGILPNVAGRINFDYSRYDYRNAAVTYYYATAGMSYGIHEQWDILIDAGGSYTVSESTPFSGTRKDEGTGWVGEAGLSYKGELTNGEFRFSHRVLPAYGFAGVTTRTMLTIGLNRRFTYELFGGLSASGFLNEATQGKFSTVGIDTRTLVFNPWVRYEFTRDVSLEASYNFALVQDRIANTEPHRNLFMLRFNIQHPFFE